MEVSLRRALVFAHFDPHDIVDPHVLYALRCYRQYFSVVVFVTTCALSNSEIRSLHLLVDKVIVRQNIGYDFLSWKTGFESLKNIAALDEVVFANDSCYGPCTDIGEFFKNAECLKGDLWGASMNRQFSPDIQSFFMGFGKKTLRTGFARRFWQSVDIVDDKFQLILKYEVGLSALALSEGFAVKGLVDYEHVNEDCLGRVIADNYSQMDEERGLIGLINVLKEAYPNPVQSFWGESLRRGLPFVKVELLRNNFNSVNLSSLVVAIKRNTNYDVHLIKNHLERVTRCTIFPPPAHRSNAPIA